MEKEGLKEVKGTKNDPIRLPLYLRSCRAVFTRENLNEEVPSALAEVWLSLLFLSACFPAPLLRLRAFLVWNKWVISATLYLSHLSDPE